MIKSSISFLDIEENIVNYVSINQENSHICLGTSTGFKVFETNPLVLIHEEKCGPIAIIEMINTSNLFLLVGKTEFSDFSPKKISLWSKIVEPKKQKTSLNNRDQEIKQYSKLLKTGKNKEKIILYEKQESKELEGKGSNKEKEKGTEEIFEPYKTSLKPSSTTKDTPPFKSIISPNNSPLHLKNPEKEKETIYSSFHYSQELNAEGTSNEGFENLESQDNPEDSEQLSTGRILCTSSSFDDSITSVKINKNFLVVFVSTVMHIFKTSEMKNIASVEIGTLVTSTMTLSGAPMLTNFLAFSVKQHPGVVKLFNLLMLSLVNTVDAHRTAVTSLQLNYQNSLLATASQKGTVIRVFSLPDLRKVFTFKRGLSEAQVFDLKFSLSSEFLGATSDSGTLHLFLLEDLGEIGNISGTTGKLGKGKPGLKNGEEGGNLVSSVFSGLYSCVSSGMSSIGHSLIPGKYLEDIDYRRSLCSLNKEEFRTSSKVGVCDWVDSLEDRYGGNVSWSGDSSGGVCGNGSGGGNSKSISLFVVDKSGLFTKINHDSKGNTLVADKSVMLTSLELVN